MLVAADDAQQRDGDDVEQLMPLALRNPWVVHRCETVPHPARRQFYRCCTSELVSRVHNASPHSLFRRLSENAVALNRSAAKIVVF